MESESASSLQKDHKLLHKQQVPFPLLIGGVGGEHNLKFENCVLFSGHSENWILGHSISENSERLHQKGKGESQNKWEFLQQKTRWLEDQKKDYC